MRKSLHVLIAVVAFALMGSIVFAYAPVVKPLPDVYIGDAEDNVGTVDINLYRFSNAFDLDDYVSDQDSTISELVWSFYEGTVTDNVEINGIYQLADPSDAINADTLGKDIRHPSDPDFQPGNLVDFWDELDSPRGSVPPGPGADPPALNEIITMFVSDGLYVDSGQMKVEAIEGTDYISATTVWEPVASFDFEGDQDGWTYFSFAVNAYDQQYATATSNFNGSALGVTTDNATSRFGYWQGPAVANEAGKLFKYAWNISTSQTIQDQVPSARLRVSNVGLTWVHTMSIESNGVTNPNAPTPAGKVYNQYVLPLSTDDMFPVFDVYDFTSGTGGDNGTVWMEELDVFKTDVPASGWTDETVPPLSSWAVLNGPGPYNDVTTGTSGGLQLGSNLANDRSYGYWNGVTSIALQADTMYRAVFTISSSDTTTLPQCMVRVNAADLQVAYRLTAYDPVGPDSDGNDYPVYFESHDFLASPLDVIGLAFELGDFETGTAGTFTLTNASVQSMPVLP